MTTKSLCKGLNMPLPLNLYRPKKSSRAPRWYVIIMDELTAASLRNFEGVSILAREANSAPRKMREALNP